MIGIQKQEGWFSFTRGLNKYAEHWNKSNIIIDLIIMNSKQIVNNYKF